MLRFRQIQKLYGVVAWAMMLCIVMNAVAMHPPSIQVANTQAIEQMDPHTGDAGGDEGSMQHDDLHDYHAHGTIVPERNESIAVSCARFTSVTQKMPEGAAPTLKRPPRSARG